MVGLRASRCFPPGSLLVVDAAGLSPMAAALADHLLPSQCASCFAPTGDQARCCCAGPCHGSVAYCSVSCMNLDLDLHMASGECCLLAVIQGFEASFAASPACRWQGCTNFPSLGGTCDLRAALRLLTYYEDRGSVSYFLASGMEAHGSRLGGLLSNRCVLLDASPLNSDAEPHTRMDCMHAHDDPLANLMSTPDIYSDNGGIKRVSFVSGYEESTAVPLMTGLKNPHFATLQPSISDLNNQVNDGDENERPLGMELAEAARLMRYAKNLSSFVNTIGYNTEREQKKGGDDTKEKVQAEVMSQQTCFSMDSRCKRTCVSMWPVNFEEQTVLMEEVICQVLTNGVQIQIDDGLDSYLLDAGSESCLRLGDLGCAVYDPQFSWINHSCRPNAFYRFVLKGPIPDINIVCDNASPLVPTTNIAAAEKAWGLEFHKLPWLSRTPSQTSSWSRVWTKGYCAIHHKLE